MIKRYLTPEEIHLYDETGNASRFLKSLAHSSPTNMSGYWAFTSFSNALEGYISLRNKIASSRHEPIIRYDDELISKCGPQGGSVPLAEIEQLAVKYFDTRPKCDGKRCQQGLSYLLAAVKSAINRYGIPSPIPGYKGVIGTNAALPLWGKKGSFIQETYGMSDWRHATPAVPGHRYMRNSHRIIFQASIQNLRYIEEYLTRIRRWLRNYIPEFFGGWLRESSYVAPTLNSVVQHEFVSNEDDYEKCDVHTSFDLVRYYVFPVYELLLSPMEFARLAAFVEETFESPLFMGDYVLEGEHSLFSGEPFTNDFETIFDAVLETQAAIDVSIPPSRVIKFNNGDDVTNILTHPKDLPHAAIFHSAYADAAHACGHVIETHKCRTSSTDIRFCRQVYYRSGKRYYSIEGRECLRGAYPPVLTLNSCYQPERYTSEYIGAVFQRLDNSIGFYGFEPFVQYVISHFKPARERVYTYEELTAPVDWWERLYGERWNPRSSASVQIALKSHLIKLDSSSR